MIGQAESLGNPEPGWYAARHWSESRSFGGSGWSEVTTGIEVVPLAKHDGSES